MDGHIFVIGCELPELRRHGLAGSAKGGIEFDDDDAVRRPRSQDFIEAIQALDGTHYRLQGRNKGKREGAVVGYIASAWLLGGGEDIRSASRRKRTVTHLVCSRIEKQPRGGALPNRGGSSAQEARAEVHHEEEKKEREASHDVERGYVWVPGSLSNYRI